MKTNRAIVWRELNMAVNLVCVKCNETNSQTIKIKREHEIIVMSTVLHVASAHRFPSNWMQIALKRELCTQYSNTECGRRMLSKNGNHCARHAKHSVWFISLVTFNLICRCASKVWQIRYANVFRFSHFMSFVVVSFIMLLKILN